MEEITLSRLSFGPDSRDRRSESADPGLDGALAALETFYYALNNRDAETLAAVVARHPLAQLNNPLGGILRGGAEIVDLYASMIFRGRVRIEVTFSDFVQYLGDRHALFAGRETGTYTVGDTEPQALAIRTSRYFRYEASRWLQFHHHGSIDDAALLERLPGGGPRLSGGHRARRDPRLRRLRRAREAVYCVCALRKRAGTASR